MKSYSLIHQLITLVEQLESENGPKELTILDFAGFLNSSLEKPATQKPGLNTPFGKNDEKTVAVAGQLENNIGRLIGFLNRYAKYYIKKALEGTPLLSVEDFSCLGILLTHDHLSQSELIILNVQEKTSGVQVIRRLITAGLAKQWSDPVDKRGKRIAITEKGRKCMYSIFNDMNNVSKIVTATLTTPEKTTLLHLLQKLEHYHHTEYQNKSVSSKKDLQAQAEKLKTLILASNS